MQEIKEIKEIRRKLNITQIELAKKADVSQSLIAKVEAGRLDPTYSNANKIFNALNELSKKQETKVEEIMVKKVISVSSEDDVKDIITKMRKNEISQVPVIEKEKLIGYIEESDILNSIDKKDAKAKDIMKDNPPTITKDASITVATDLLKFYPIILIIEKGKPIGVITKADIIGKAYKKGTFF